MSRSQNGVIYTFYSYKGGVGRSMALVNIAELMYQAGLKVLMVDWDLEAPGLERYFPDQANRVLESLGLVNMMLEYIDEKDRNDDDSFPMDSIADYLVDIYPEAVGSGHLSILPAGQRADNKIDQYAQHLQSLDWDEFYYKWDGSEYFAWLRDKFKAFDVTLIDSRTGVTEMGGVCTYYLADVVVAFCAANEQNMDGTLKMLKSFKNPEVTKQRGGQALETLVVPSRIDGIGSIELLNQFRDKFAKEFAGYISSNLLPKIDPNQSFLPEQRPITPKLFFLKFEIPYISDYSHMERVAVNEDESSSYWTPNMVDAYRELRDTLAKLASPETRVRQRIFPFKSSTFESSGISEADRPKIGRYEIMTPLTTRNTKVVNVYLARDPNLERQVVLKEIGTDKNWDWAIKQRFKREARAIGRLNHPNIITIHDVDLENDPPFMVMEYLRGGTLRKRLQERLQSKQGPLPWLEALQLLRPLVLALAYAHDKEVIHRNITPANVMFTEIDDSPKLTDFGLVYLSESERITSTGVSLGRIEYISPEQHLGQAVDKRADIFSVGVILFEMIGGRNILSKLGKHQRKIDKLQSDEPFDLSALQAKAPSEVVALIAKAVAKNRGERYASCDELLVDLDRCLLRGE
ncbi:protein kinase [Anaerolineales bacterium HSG6]|nr:protein kinase [Anaerolineales bacterium HSG6]